MTDEQSLQRPTADDLSLLERRRFLAVGSGIGTAIIAGCTSSDSDGTDGDGGDGDGGDGDGTDGGDGDGDGSSGPESDDSTSSTVGNFRLLITDAPADIDDFDSLEVTFDSARIFDGNGDSEEEEGEEGGDGEEGDESTGDGETGEDGTDGSEETDEQSTEDSGSVDDGAGDGTEEDGQTEGGEETESGGEPQSQDGSEDGTDGGDDSEESGDDEGDGVERRRGYYWLDLDGSTVDLTEVVGDKAQSVFEGELDEGTYNKIELHVADIAGVVDGEAAEVKVPSEKLQITNSFTIGPDEPVDFVFDINVVKRGQGNSYNLTPVISGSGVNGEDVDVEEVDEDEAEDEGDSDDGEDGTGEDESGDDGTDDADGDGTDAEGGDDDGSGDDDGPPEDAGDGGA